MSSLSPKPPTKVLTTAKTSGRQARVFTLPTMATNARKDAIFKPKEIGTEVAADIKPSVYDESTLTVRINVPPGVTDSKRKPLKPTWEADESREHSERIFHDSFDPAERMQMSIEVSLGTGQTDEDFVEIIRKEASDRCRIETSFCWWFDSVEKEERRQRLEVFDVLIRNFEFDEQWEREAFEEDSETAFNQVTWECYQSLMQDEMQLDEATARNNIVWKSVDEAILSLQKAQELEAKSIEEEENHLWWSEVQQQFQASFPLAKVQHQWDRTRHRVLGWEFEDRSDLIVAPELLAWERANMEGQEERLCRLEVETAWYDGFIHMALAFDRSVREVLLSFYAPPGDIMTAKEMMEEAALRIQHCFRSKRGQTEARYEGIRLQEQRALADVAKA